MAAVCYGPNFLLEYLIMQDHLGWMVGKMTCATVYIARTLGWREFWNARLMVGAYEEE